VSSARFDIYIRVPCSGSRGAAADQWSNSQSSVLGQMDSARLGMNHGLRLSAQFMIHFGPHGYIPRYDTFSGKDDTAARIKRNAKNHRVVGPFRLCMCLQAVNISAEPFGFALRYWIRPQSCYCARTTIHKCGCCADESFFCHSA
jgi:hypothetical protein